MKITSKTTVGEIKSVCLKHLKAARDCETCPIYKFCNRNFSYEYPGGWKLEEVDNNAEK